VLMPGEAIDISGDVGVWRSTPLNAADDGFLAGTSLPLTVRARGYRDDHAVWQAMRTSPGLAVVDGNALASSPADLADRTAFTLTRVFRGQATMEPETVWVRGQQGGRPIKLTVIGVLDPRATLAVGVISSTVTFVQGMSISGGRTFYFRVKPGLDVHQVAKGLGLSFVQSGMQTQVLADELQRIEGVRILLNELIQSYLGLGLVVGVAALGVISTRAVVERRQHIGMLRALGFQRGMVQISFLLETAFIAVGGTVLGVALGLQLARSLTGYIAQEHPEIVFSVPWAQLLFIGSITCVASLLATWIPARRASRVLPAEALRYE
jgi:putative ABC transport system permease protein